MMENVQGTVRGCVGGGVGRGFEVLAKRKQDDLGSGDEHHACVAVGQTRAAGGVEGVHVVRQHRERGEHIPDACEPHGLWGEWGPQPRASEGLDAMHVPRRGVHGCSRLILGEDFGVYDRILQPKTAITLCQ